MNRVTSVVMGGLARLGFAGKPPPYPRMDTPNRRALSDCSPPVGGSHNASFSDGNYTPSVFLTGSYFTPTCSEVRACFKREAALGTSDSAQAAAFQNTVNEFCAGHDKPPKPLFIDLNQTIARALEVFGVEPANFYVGGPSLGLPYSDYLGFGNIIDQQSLRLAWYLEHWLGVCPSDFFNRLLFDENVPVEDLWGLLTGIPSMYMPSDTTKERLLCFVSLGPSGPPSPPRAPAPPRNPSSSPVSPPSSSSMCPTASSADFLGSLVGFEDHGFCFEQAGAGGGARFIRKVPSYWVIGVDPNITRAIIEEMQRRCEREGEGFCVAERLMSDDVTVREAVGDTGYFQDENFWRSLDLQNFKSYSPNGNGWGFYTAMSFWYFSDFPGQQDPVGSHRVFYSKVLALPDENMAFELFTGSNRADKPPNWFRDTMCQARVLTPPPSPPPVPLPPPPPAPSPPPVPLPPGGPPPLVPGPSPPPPSPSGPPPSPSGPPPSPPPSPQQPILPDEYFKTLECQEMFVPVSQVVMKTKEGVVSTDEAPGFVGYFEQRSFEASFLRVQDYINASLRQEQNLTRELYDRCFDALRLVVQKDCEQVKNRTVGSCPVYLQDNIMNRFLNYKGQTYEGESV